MFKSFSSIKIRRSKKLKKSSGRKFLEFSLLFGGLLLLLTPLAIGNFVNRQLLQNPQIPQSPQKSLPLRIIIPRVSVDLPVRQAQVEGNNWELFEDAASFLLTSAKIGQAGNTVIYAHAKPHLFGPLKKIKKGERIYILTNNSWAFYEIIETKTVPPSKIEVVLPTEEETLTLYTCANFLDKDRLVVSAKLLRIAFELTEGLKD